MSASYFLFERKGERDENMLKDRKAKQKYFTFYIPYTQTGTPMAKRDKITIIKMGLLKQGQGRPPLLLMFMGGEYFTIVLTKNIYEMGLEEGHRRVFSPVRMVFLEQASLLLLSSII